MRYFSAQTNIDRVCVIRTERCMSKDPNQDTPTTTAPTEPAPARRPYEPPTLIKRGALSTLVAQTITATPPPSASAL
jgi:hypothetical protein